MNVSYIEINGEKLPVKWSTRAKINWEKSSGLKWADLLGTTDKKGNWLKMPVTADTEQSIMMCYEILKEGHRIEGKEFKMSLEDVMEMQDEHDLEAKITAVIYPQPEEGKGKK